MTNSTLTRCWQRTLRHVGIILAGISLLLSSASAAPLTRPRPALSIRELFKKLRRSFLGSRHR